MSDGYLHQTTERLQIAAINRELMKHRTPSMSCCLSHEQQQWIEDVKDSIRQSPEYQRYEETLDFLTEWLEESTAHGAPADFLEKIQARIRSVESEQLALLDTESDEFANAAEALADQIEERRNPDAYHGVWPSMLR